MDNTRLLPVTTELAAHLDHRRVLVEGAPFDDALRVWNHAVDHRPAVVVRCATPDDVSTAVTVAGRHGLPVTVLGGGHDWGGRSIRDGAWSSPCRTCAPYASIRNGVSPSAAAAPPRPM
jgi:hypothetical protein